MIIIIIMPVIITIRVGLTGLQVELEAPIPCQVPFPTLDPLALLVALLVAALRRPKTDSANQWQSLLGDNLSGSGYSGLLAVNLNQYKILHRLTRALRITASPSHCQPVGAA